jgi:acyl-coenzyme A thioesterase PaaI-like protein
MKPCGLTSERFTWLSLSSAVPTTSPDDLALARVRAGLAIRNLGHAVVGHAADVDRLEQLSALLEAQIALFETGQVRVRASERPDGDWGPAPVDGDEMFSYGERPISGQASPYGLDVRVFRDGDEAVGHVAFGAAHEGAPGRCHGGIVSALFDDVYGFVLGLTAQPAFTGTLTIRYERGVPIGVPLQCRVRLDSVDGRKMFMSGELTGVDANGDLITYSRSTAIFITIPSISFASPG